MIILILIELIGRWKQFFECQFRVPVPQETAAGCHFCGSSPSGRLLRRCRPSLGSLRRSIRQAAGCHHQVSIASISSSYTRTFFILFVIEQQSISDSNCPEAVALSECVGRRNCRGHSADAGCPFTHQLPARIKSKSPLAFNSDVFISN